MLSTGFASWRVLYRGPPTQPANTPNLGTFKLTPQMLGPLLVPLCASPAGLFNTLYYSVAFVFVWFTVANVPSGMLLPPATLSPSKLWVCFGGCSACVFWFAPGDRPGKTPGHACTARG
jgi:hypothetical protein